MGNGVSVKGGSGLRTMYKDPIVKAPSSGSDLEFEGEAKFADPDFDLNGFKMVILVGEGELDASLKNDLE
jgi:hypothetical protein